MIDLEAELRSSLRAYADAIEPSEPGSSLVPLVGHPAAPPRTTRLLLAAAVVLGLLITVAVLVGRTGSDTVSPTPTGGGAWRVPSAMPLSPRKTPSVLWTGSEFIVWGGETGNVGLRDGALYDPRDDRWRPMAPNDRVRAGGGAVWAGDRMVVLSGAGGEAYDPVTGTWTSLPELPADEAVPGFSDAMYVDGTLLGVGIWPDAEQAGTSRIRVWKFDPARQRWFSQADAIVATTFPGSLVSVPDQFVVHQLVPTTAGFAVWDRGQIVFEYGTVARTLQSDRWLVDGTDAFALTSAGGRLTMIAGGKTPAGDDLRITSWTGDAWSPWTVLAQGGIGIVRPVPVGDDIVAFGLFLQGSTAPTRIDVAAGTAAPMIGYPIETVIDQSAAWSGAELLVCGGQRPTNAPEVSTDDPGPVSNECAIWTP